LLLPFPVVAPLFPPVTFPIVHVNFYCAVAANGILVALLLRSSAVDGTPVILGVGLTVTTTLYGDADGQLPVVLVAVIRYSTVLALALLGLVSVCAIVLPDPAVAPVILPVTVPIVHVKPDGAVAAKAILVDVLLQIAAVDGTPLTCGVGLTVTVTVYGDADGQLPVVLVAVTKY